jgi:hypothetical protein
MLIFLNRLSGTFLLHFFHFKKSFFIVIHFLFKCFLLCLRSEADQLLYYKNNVYNHGCIQILHYTHVKYFILHLALNYILGEFTNIEYAH